MRHKLIIDGNAVYEVDDECMACQEEAKQTPPGARAGDGPKTPSETKTGARMPSDAKSGPGPARRQGQTGRRQGRSRPFIR